MKSGVKNSLERKYNCLFYFIW